MKKRYKSIFTLMLVFIALSYVFDGFTKTQTEREKLPSGPDPTKLEEQPEEELPPLPGEAEEPGFEAEAPLGDEELGAEEPVEDVDLSQEEADVLINLGRKLEAEMGGEEGLPPEEEGLPPEEVEMGPPPEAGMPPEEAAMAESLVRTLTGRVANRIKKDYVVNEVMKRVAKRLYRAPRKK